MSHRKLPDVKVLVKHLEEEGMTYAQVAELYGSSKQAVSAALDRANVDLGRAQRSYRDHIPWRVKVEHNSHLLVKMLRLHARSQLGLPIQPADLAKHDQWLQYMKLHDAVVVYHPDHGFGLDERRPGDSDLTRP